MDTRRTVLSGKEWLALKHLSKNAPSAPNVDCNIVLLPCEHGFGGPIIPRRDVASHLRSLYSGETKITNLGCWAVSQRKAERYQVRTLRSQFSLIRRWLGLYRTKMRREKGDGANSRAYEIAVDDASGM